MQGSERGGGGQIPDGSNGIGCGQAQIGRTLRLFTKVVRPPSGVGTAASLRCGRKARNVAKRLPRRRLPLSPTSTAVRLPMEKWLFHNQVPYFVCPWRVA